jgi:DNA-binding winged helix-turn-helix (wHTH) protein
LERYLIEHRLVFDSHLMTFSQGNAVTGLAANEAELLLILMRGIATKQAVIEQIWESKGMFVTEGSYHQLVRSLRLKLEEQGVAGSLIKTLPRLGLKFVGAVERIADQPAAAGDRAPDLGEAAPALDETSDADTEPPPQLMPGDMAVVPSAPGPRSAPPLAMPSDIVPPVVGQTSKRRAAYYAIYALLAIWAGVLTWKIFFHRDNRFEFRFERTIDGVHYFSNGRMEQKALLGALKVTPPQGAYVYQIELGTNDWLAVCTQPIYKAPELCETYFIEKNY